MKMFDFEVGNVSGQNHRIKDEISQISFTVSNISEFQGEKNIDEFHFIKLQNLKSSKFCLVSELIF